jgi:Golgi CORVET complex core vacuolar protein 8
MDFDSIIALLRNNDMYSACSLFLINVLDYYVSPLQMLLERVFDAKMSNVCWHNPPKMTRKRTMTSI